MKQLPDRFVVRLAALVFVVVFWTVAVGACVRLGCHPADKSAPQQHDGSRANSRGG